MNESIIWANVIAHNNAKAAARQREAERRMWLRIIATMSVLLITILLAIVLDVAGLVSNIVTAVVIALAFGGLCGLTGWIVGKVGKPRYI